MFTGIVEEVGKILNSVPGRLTVKASRVLEGTKIGDSIAVNGVCLTVISKTSDSFTADVMPETLRRTNLGQSLGKNVNLERAMPCDGRFGGHIVSGHIDGTGTLESRRNEGNAVWFKINCSSELLTFIVEKGSVALDGISLTVAAVDNSSFSVSVIPHTGEETTIMQRQAGDKINIETDIVAKYVQKMLSHAGQEGHSGHSGLEGHSRQERQEGHEGHNGAQTGKGGLTLQYLEEMGI